MVQGNPINGYKLFKAHCFQCHTVEENGTNKQGPNFHGIFGRKTGQVPGNPYTVASLERDITWDEETLNINLSNPRMYILGTRVVFVELKKEKDRADVTAYLKHLKNC